MDFDKILSPTLLGDVALGQPVKVIGVVKTKGLTTERKIKSMSFYENLMLVRPDLTAAKVADLNKKYAKVVADKGGKVVKSEDWGLRDLAYKIQKNRKAYYVLTYLDAPAEAVLELERLMRLDENLLRYMTLKIDAIPEGASVMLEPKSRRIKDDKLELQIEGEQ